MLLKEVSLILHILPIVTSYCYHLSDVIAFEQTPSGGVVAPETSLTFNCEAVGTSVNWHINGSRKTPADSNNEYQIDDDLISGNYHNLTLQIVAHVGVNNTEITCFARGSQSGQSDRGSFHIIVASKSC